ncbi:MAG: S8 family serine peptidase [Phenylobacterium sp.]|uniref:S8 family peptidase n=1 Tax=Phenylobacterium sp. TaxID=1871053 RepID=UPI001A5D4325|nr:S8 family peptidase [Phenylobacterium sp.]MBL8553083.1 S8 family serine peptidase [Phenylobacterium sp.]
MTARGLGLVLAATMAFAPAVAGAKGPRVNSDEYRKSWGVEAIGARAAYDAGLSGKGVTVALVDCGLSQAQRELMRNVSRRSRDVVEGRTMPVIDRHASYVAGPLASALDGRGMVGVAYNATVIEIRADVDGGGEGGACAFKPSDLARALDYAAEQKARIVVLPLQHGKPLGARFEASLQRLVDGGAVVVIAAGNRNGPDPSWPARYAIDPRYQGAIVVAGASSYYGMITSWSNRAGQVKTWFVAAPGEWVLTDCTGKCKLVSGTSFSTSYVAGALALMMEAWPQTSGRDLIQRLLATARDEGPAGVDEVYGRGVLEVARAFGG